jgi:hypothetical protein
MENKTELLELINDIEILLKQDKRFYLSNDHKYRNNIKNLAESNKFNGQSIDVTSFVNLAKLHSQKHIIVGTKEIEPVDNSDSLKRIVARLSELNKKMDNIVH